MAVHFLKKVEVSPLFIDYLCFTYDVSDLERTVVAQNFIEILGQLPDKKELYSQKKIEIKTNDGLYHLRKDVYEADIDEHIRFYCYPRNSNSNFMKVEWLPSKTESCRVADLVNLILPGGYADLVTYGTIRRVDITTQIDGVFLPDLLYHYPNLKINKNYAGSKGNESVYMGAATSEKCFTLYDKAKQVKDKNKKKYPIHKCTIPSGKKIQVEFKFKPKKQQITLSNLSTLAKPHYEKLEIMRLCFLPKQETVFDSLVNVTISNMQTRGFNKALQMIDGKKRRDEVENRVRKLCRAAWWDPVGLWGTMPLAIEPIMNPIPSKWKNMKN